MVCLSLHSFQVGLQIFLLPFSVWRSDPHAQKNVLTSQQRGVYGSNGCRRLGIDFTRRRRKWNVWLVCDRHSQIKNVDVIARRRKLKNKATIWCLWRDCDVMRFTDADFLHEFIIILSLFTSGFTASDFFSCRITMHNYDVNYVCDMIVQQQPPKAVAISFNFFFIGFLHLVMIFMTTLLALIAQQL